uniref:Uncharacterized protein n=1 Tax=Anguilla anguilla TaxID=7936 RepID=A0A0E9RC51_ANGAN
MSFGHKLTSSVVPSCDSCYITRVTALHQPHVEAFKEQERCYPS